MTSDARFEDGRETPLNLGAQDVADLEIISALVQDAVFPITEMRWQPRLRRFVIMLNRFRWEDPGLAHRGPERVGALLVFDEVLKVSSIGIDRSERDTVLSLLSVAFQPGPDGTGRVELTLAGDGAIRLDVETLSLTLRDVTRPYHAPSGRIPSHD